MSVPYIVSSYPYCTVVLYIVLVPVISRSRIRRSSSSITINHSSSLYIDQHHVNAHYWRRRSIATQSTARTDRPRMAQRPRLRSRASPSATLRAGHPAQCVPPGSAVWRGTSVSGDSVHRSPRTAPGWMAVSAPAHTARAPMRTRCVRASRPPPPAPPPPLPLSTVSTYTSAPSPTMAPSPMSIAERSAACE